MDDINRDPIRWERSMTQDKEGQYVSFHDYATLLSKYDTLSAQLSEAQTRIYVQRGVLNDMSSERDALTSRMTRAEASEEVLRAQLSEAQAKGENP